MLKYKNIDNLFESAIGLADVSKKWKWSRVTAEKSQAKLDKFIELRGEIAHRGGAETSVTKAQVIEYLKLIKTIAAKTGGAVKTHVKRITGIQLF